MKGNLTFRVYFLSFLYFNVIFYSTFFFFLPFPNNQKSSRVINLICKYLDIRSLKNKRNLWRKIEDEMKNIAEKFEK